MSVTVIIAASGSGLRMGGDMPKQFQLLGGKPVLAHTLEAFNRLDIVREIIVAVPADYVEHSRELVNVHGFGKVSAIVPGGSNRAASVYASLKELCGGIVLIHDGVRPFISERLIRAVANTAGTYGAAVAGIPLTDTIKEVGNNAQVISTPDRKRFWRVQTPQAFTYELITKAYALGEKEEILAQATDDSMLVERLGVPVQMVEGNASNIKITTWEDMALGEILIKEKTRR